jgi:hypothetical protein
LPSSQHPARFPAARFRRLPCQLKNVLMCGMNYFIQHSELRGIYDKVVAGERISVFAPSCFSALFEP